MNRAKLKALVHYVIAKSDAVRLGAIRLNKIMWYADTLAYRATGASLTGGTYVKRQNGPVSRHTLDILRELEEEGAIVVRDRDRLGFNMKEYISLRDPDTKPLSEPELGLIEDMRAYICDHHTANSISELSHDQVWDAANMGEMIPMEATLAAVSGEMGPEVMKWADSVIGRYEAIVGR